MPIKLIGIQTGTYEGNNWAKIHIAEPFFRSDGCLGERVTSIKCDYNLAVSLLGKKEIIGKEIECWYDRNGKVQDISY